MLRPTLPARLMNAATGLLLLLPALAVAAEETPLPDVGGLPLLAGGIWLSWRGYRLGVICANGVVIVHGYRRDYAISCPDITHLDRGEIPVIIWTDDSGRDRDTKLYAFCANPHWPSLEVQQARSLKRLRDYIKKYRRRR